MSEMTLEQVRDWHLAHTNYVHLPITNRAHKDMADAITTHLAQPAQAVDVGAYAERLARALWRKHYADDAPQWEPVTGDLYGLLTQIDNMTTGLTRALSGEKAGPVDGWISVTDRLPECDMTPNSFGVPVEVKPGFFDGMKRVPNAFYGCRQTDRPNFYLYGAVFYPTHWRYPASPAPDKEG